MKVVEFFLKPNVPEQSFDVLCDRFYSVGQKIKRKVDSVRSTPVYSITHNPNTNWVQLLIDDNVSNSDLAQIKGIARGLSDNSSLSIQQKSRDNEAPLERSRIEIESGVS